MSLEGRTRTVGLDGAAGRWVLAVAALGSGMVFLDGTAVLVALPSIGRELGGSLALQQWIVAGYLLTLGTLVLAGSALTAALGSDRAFLVGAVAFGAASALCASSPAGGALVVARLLQGATAALLAPASLGVVSSGFPPEDRDRALALWAAIAGAATVAGPVVGGLLVDHAGWRWVFLINLPLAGAAAALGIRFLPRRKGSAVHLGARLHLGGAAGSLLGLGLLSYGLIEGPSLGFHRLQIAGSLLLGALVLGALVALEARRPRPPRPLALLGVRAFAVSNLITFLVYAGLTTALMLLVLELQEVLGYGALASGTALLPVTLLLLLSPLVAAPLSRMEARRPLAAGTATAAVGLLLYLRVGAGASLLSVVLPASAVLGAGLAVMALPLSATLLGSVPSVRAAAASEVNNLVARVAGVAGVAAIPLISGLASRPLAGDAFTAGFHRAVVVAALLCLAAAGVSIAGLRPPSGSSGPV